MSIAGVWHPIKNGGPCYLLINETTSTGESEQITKELIIDDMVKVRFKEETKYCGNKLELSLKCSVSKHELGSHCSIQANVVCETMKYSENGITVPDNWSIWKPMGTMKPTHETQLDGKKIFIFSVEILINVYEVKLNTISPKLYTDTDFTDFNLCTTDGSVAVHKVCMAVNSDVFRAMLSNEWKETTEGQINMKGVTVQTLQHLKDYMYLGTVPDEGLRPLLLIARLYLIEDLEKHCIRKLAAAVEPDGLFSLIEFACENQIPELPYAILHMTPDSVVNQSYRMKKIMEKSG